MIPRLVALACGLVAAGTLAGCATARAAAPAPLPELVPPEAPPRIVAEYEPDPPLPAEPVSAGAVTAPPRAVRPPRRDPPRPEAAPDDAQAPALQPAPPAPPVALAIQTPGASAKADQSIRQLLARAARDLGRLDYRGLDSDRRTQYDTAKGFMQQAEDALRARNVMFAGKLADKAATMAAALVR
ncbi:MAG: hypothetical protein AB7O28_21365 [Vicinamibacterales bacterium]